MGLESKLKENIEKSDIDFDSLDLKRKTNYSIEWDLITYIRDVKDLDNQKDENGRYISQIKEIFESSIGYTRINDLLNVESIVKEAYSENKNIDEIKKYLVKQIEKEDYLMQVSTGLHNYSGIKNMNNEDIRNIKKLRNEINAIVEVWERLVPEEDEN